MTDVHSVGGRTGRDLDDAGLPPLVSLQRDHAEVEPGQAERTEVVVRNPSGIVESYDLTVLGPASSWVSVLPESLSLFPGEESTATVTARPPLTSTVVAGEYTVGVRAVSHVSRDRSASDELVISVAPFYRFVTDISRATFAVRTKAKTQVRIVNEGNATVTYGVAAYDPDGYMRVSLERNLVTLAPGEAAWVPIQAKMAPRPFGTDNNVRTVTTTITPLRNADTDVALVDAQPQEQRINILHRPFVRLRLGLFGRLVFLLGILALIAAFVYSRFVANQPPLPVGAPPVPSNFASALDADGKPVLTWDAAPGATGYSIYSVAQPDAPSGPAAPAAAPAAVTPSDPLAAPARGAVLAVQLVVATVTPTPDPGRTVSGIPSQPSPICEGCTEVATVDGGTTRYVIEQPTPGESCWKIAAKVGDTQSLYSAQTCLDVPDPALVDENGDGTPDAVDTDGDGTPDAPAVDSDGDGTPDAPAAAVAPCPPAKARARVISPTAVAVLWKQAVKPPAGMMAPDQLPAGQPASADPDPTLCDPAKQITGWSVQRKIFSGWSDVTPEPKADDTAVEITDLDPGRKYCFRMRAKAADGDSVYTDKFCVTTPSNEPVVDPGAADAQAPTPAASAPAVPPAPPAPAAAS